MLEGKYNIDDMIEEWHSSDGTVPLYEYLGMTREEYNEWLYGEINYDD